MAAVSCAHVKGDSSHLVSLSLPRLSEVWGGLAPLPAACSPTPCPPPGLSPVTPALCWTLGLKVALSTSEDDTLGQHETPGRSDARSEERHAHGCTAVSTSETLVAHPGRAGHHALRTLEGSTERPKGRGTTLKRGLPAPVETSDDAAQPTPASHPRRASGQDQPAEPLSNS